MRRVALVIAVIVSACSSSTPSADETIPPVTSSSTMPVVLDPQPGALGIGDRLYPDLGNGGYDVDSYLIRFAFEPKTGRIDGRTVVVAMATQDLSEFSLDLVGMTVATVEVALDEPEEASFRREGRELIVTPPEPIPNDQLFRVLVVYEGIPAPVPQRGAPFQSGWRTTEDGSVYVFSQPDGAAGWFPANDHPLDRADVRLEVTVPAGLTVVSGGAPSSSEDGLFVWEMEDVAPYLVPLAIGEFASESESYGNLAITTWYEPGLPDSVLHPFRRQDEMVAFFEDRFGPYPFSSLGALIVDDGLGAALETQTLPTYTRISAQWGELVIAHEIAHQWFGDAITLEQWDDVWLNEGFATLAHWLWLEHDEGPERYRTEVTRAYGRISGLDLVTDEGLDNATAAARAADSYPPPDHPAADDLFNPSVYQRGGLALVALRDSVGDDAFFDLIRTYVERYSGSTITTEGFLALVEAELGSAASRLVGSWVGDATIPPLPAFDLAPPGV